MNNDISGEMIGVIRREQARRLPEITDENQDYVLDHWLFKDEPFLNELCLMLLVVQRHQLERNLIWLAAKLGETDTILSQQQYKENIRQEREECRKRDGWKKLCKKLKLESCEGFDAIEIHRLLVNSYKHHPLMEPDEELVSKLRIDTIINFASLPENDLIRERVANSIGLPGGATYCDIAEGFMHIVTRFFDRVQVQATFSEVRLDRVSFNPKDFAQ
jgi:hypothetical protein